MLTNFQTLYIFLKIFTLDVKGIIAGNIFQTKNSDFGIYLCGKFDLRLNA